MSNLRHAGQRWLLLLLLLCVGCAAPLPEGTPVATAGTPYLTDTFDPPHSAWVRFDTEAGAAYALQGEFFLEDRGRGIAVYSPLLDEVHTDVTIGVQLRHVQGSFNNWMGVLCRQQDEENYYLFAISADGYYLLLRVQDGAPTALTGPQTSAAIQKGKAVNTLTARCRGTSLSLWINDALVVTRVDEALAEAGQVALFADAVDSGQTTTVAFTDFTLSAP